MDTMMCALLALALVLLASNPVFSRTCYDCVSVETGDNAHIGDFITDASAADSACVQAGLMSIASLKSQKCDEGERCAAIKGFVTTPTGSSATVTRRMCRYADTDGCLFNNEATLALQAALKTGVTFGIDDAELCYCDRDYCSPINCPGTYQKVFGYCLHYGVIAGFIAAIILILVLLTGCCFCCCCCCKCCKN